jgi:hypothetical protein
MNIILICILINLFSATQSITPSVQTPSLSPPMSLPMIKTLKPLRLIVIGKPDLVIPLKNINVNIKVMDTLARIEIEQEYENDNEEALETEYYFPISDKSVFDSFQAQVGARTIIGEIKEKEQAKKEYTEEVAKGNTVAYSEIDKSKDIMKVLIGNLLPKQAIKIKYSYLEMLDVTMNKFWRLIVFSTLTPLYQPEDDKTPPPPITNIIPDNKTYKWMINAEITSQEPITFLRSPSHDKNIDITYSPDKRTATIKMDNKQQYDPNKNFEFYYSTSGDNKPTLAIEESDKVAGDNVALITFFPQFNTLSTQQADEFAQNKKNSDIDPKSREEFIFIADRSGSMLGERYDNMKKALTQIIKEIPDKSLFNIISFGSTFEKMYPESVLVEKFRQDAVDKIATWTNDLGGTEILAPLQEALKGPSLNGLPKIIFLLTDGDVSNADEIIKIARENRAKARINTIGIGNGVSNHFIKTVAKASNGIYEFVNKSEELNSKVMQFIYNSISPYLNDFKIDFTPDSQQMIQETYPKLSDIQFILKNEPFRLYIFLKKGIGMDKLNNLQADISYFNSYTNNKESNKIQASKNEVSQETILHKVAIKQKLDDLEASKNEDSANADNIKKEMVDLSVKNQVLCSETAFIVKIQENNKVTEKPVKMLVPNILSDDYSGMAYASMAYAAMPQSISRYAGNSMAFSPGYIYNNNNNNNNSNSIGSSNNNNNNNDADSSGGQTSATANEQADSSVGDSVASTILSKLIPDEYWVNEQGQKSGDRKFVIFKTEDGKFLTCDANTNNITFTDKFDQSIIFTIRENKDGTITFVTQQGNFLQLKADGSLTCGSKDENNQTKFNVLKIKQMMNIKGIKLQNADGLTYKYTYKNDQGVNNESSILLF